MTLQQLRYLLGVVDNGLNITAAASALHTSQPGISKQLKMLEQELGLALFTRRGKSLEAITPEGEEVVARARRIIEEVGNIRTLADNLSAEATGELSIGTTHTQARYVLPGVIKEFRQRYPNINLALHQGTSEQIAEMVESGIVNVAIASGSRELFSSMVLLPCFSWHRVAIVPKDHELAKFKGKLDLATLAGHPLVTYVFSHTGHSSFKTAFAEKSLVPDVVFTARDADVIKTYVRVGMGVGVLAPMAFTCEDQRDLVALDASDCLPRCNTWIGLRRDQVLRNYVTDFAALLAPHLTNSIVEEAVQQESQSAVDALFADIEVPERGGCLRPVDDVA